MPHSRASLLLHLALTCTFCLAGLRSLSATAADEELTLLTIQGDLVGKVESLDEAIDSALIINTYYSLLPEEVQTDLETLRHQLSALVPDYEVAFTATDSAELSEVMDEIDVLWAAIRTIHEQEFTPEVVELLNEAYGNIFSLIGPE